jgi:hypothetical protein
MRNENVKCEQIRIRILSNEVWPVTWYRLKWIKSADALNSNFIGMTTLHVSGSFSAHHQEFWAVRRLWYIICSCGDPMLPGVGWHWQCHVACRVVIPIKLEFCASVGFIHFNLLRCTVIRILKKKLRGTVLGREFRRENKKMGINKTNKQTR